MAVREHWEIKWIQWIAVQENWVTQVSIADTINFVWGATVTDVWWVPTVNIPYWCTWYREDVTAGSATYTFVHSPATDTSFLVFTDSGTLLFLGIDYTYDSDTETITFLSLGANEAAYIWVAHTLANWGWIGDMVKAVYDPTNINASAFDYNNFINTPTIPTSVLDLTDGDEYVKWPASATDWHIALYDWATGKLIKDSWLSIDVVTTQPSGDECKIYYDNGTIHFYIETKNILLENWNNIITETWNNILVLE